MGTIMPFKGEEFELSLTWEGDTFEVRGPELAQSLGHRDAADLVRALPDNEKIKRADETGQTRSEIVRTPSDQQVWYVTEAGFYRAIGQRQPDRIKDASVRESVIRFQNWIYREVLPQIRRTGTYAAPEIPPATFTEAPWYTMPPLDGDHTERRKWSETMNATVRMHQHIQGMDLYLRQMAQTHGIPEDQIAEALVELAGAFERTEMLYHQLRLITARRHGLGSVRWTPSSDTER